MSSCRATNANLIESARPHVCRPETQGYGHGWADVAALLRASDSAPVVMDYSVSDTFPSRIHFTEEQKTEPYEEWEERPDEERWSMALDSLRAVPGLELRPDDWASVRFGDGLTALDIREAIIAACEKE